MGARLRLEQHVLTFFFLTCALIQVLIMFVSGARRGKKKERAGKSEKPQPEFIRISQPASCYSGNVNVACASALQSCWNTHKHTQTLSSISRDEHVINARTHVCGEKREKFQSVSAA